VEDVRARRSRPGECLAPGGDEPFVGLVVDGREDAIRSARPVLVRGLEGTVAAFGSASPPGGRVVDRYDGDPREEARRMTLLAGTPERTGGERTSQPMVGNTRQRARATCAAAREEEERRDDATTRTPRRRAAASPLVPACTEFAIDSNSLLETGRAQALRRAPLCVCLCAGMSACASLAAAGSAAGADRAARVPRIGPRPRWRAHG
jgi:hypothetical protein